MALRKAMSYSRRPARPYTRVSRAKGKSYIKVVPHNKIAKYSMGNGADYRAGKFPMTVSLLADAWVQVRDNALESGRMMFSKILDEKIPNQYYFEIKAHPHHILRNNKTAAGAGADRLSTGMKQSFGIVEGRAAMIGAGRPIFFVACANEHSARIIREVMHMAKAKIPGKTIIRFEKNA